MSARLVLTVFLLALLAGMPACAPALPEIASSSIEPSAPVPDGPPHGLNITVDPRIELLAVVQALSGYEKQTRLITDYDLPYKQELLETFTPYQDHAAVRQFDGMSQRGFTFDAPPAVMLYLTEPPELAVHTPFTDYLINRAGGKESLGQFLTAMRSFAAESDFMTFYNAHLEYYDQVTAQVKEMLSGTDEIAVLEDYYGLRQNSYNIILAPLFHPGGFGPSVAREGGLADIYSINGPQGMADGGLPTFGSHESYRYLIWHEFAHSFVNPQTVLHLDAVMAYDNLYRPIAKQMKDQAYPNWEVAVNEHIVRAVTVRLAARQISAEEGQARIEKERERGFAYIEPLVQALERYETRRDSYPTFNDFYPELIQVFAEEK